MKLSPHPVLLLSFALLGAGLASAVTTLSTYFARYSSFDSLIGEIDDELYGRITEMAPAEEIALFGSAVLIVASGVMLGVMVVLRGRRSATEVL